MINLSKVLGNYEITLYVMEESRITSFKIKQPLPELHKHTQNMLISGEMRIDIGEYSTTITGGSSAKFTPRAGQAPFPSGTVSTMTPLTVCQYLCVRYLPGNQLNLNIYTSLGGIQNFPSNSLITATELYTVDGVEKAPGMPTLVTSNLIIEIPAGAKIGIFEPV